MPVYRTPFTPAIQNRSRNSSSSISNIFYFISNVCGSAVCVCVLCMNLCVNTTFHFLPCSLVTLPLKVIKFNDCFQMDGFPPRWPFTKYFSLDLVFSNFDLRFVGNAFFKKLKWNEYDLLIHQGNRWTYKNMDLLIFKPRTHYFHCWAFALNVQCSSKCNLLLFFAILISFENFFKLNILIGLSEMNDCA